MKFDFETLHPNHKFAFLDGFLCGAMAAYLVYRIVEDNKSFAKPALKIVPDPATIVYTKDQ